MTHSITYKASRYAGRVVGNGHCVPFVREVAGLPPTAHWRAGGPALDAEPGTAIATFDNDGRYGNHGDGRSHAAILIGVNTKGLHVWDQWIGRPVQERLIRFKDGDALPVDDGDAYRVIEVV